MNVPEKRNEKKKTLIESKMVCGNRKNFYRI